MLGPPPATPAAKPKAPILGGLADAGIEALVVRSRSYFAT